MAYQKIVSSGAVYKGKTGMWLYIFHRITGVALFGYLILHIISTALILLGPEVYEGAEAIYKNFYFRTKLFSNFTCFTTNNFTSV